jgi:hypothetical protein
MSSIVLAYFGAETMLPLTSVVATVAGVLLIFGRNAFRTVKRAVPALLSNIFKSRSS